jgi:hypothetical protein
MIDLLSALIVEWVAHCRSIQIIALTVDQLSVTAPVTERPLTYAENEAVV